MIFSIRKEQIINYFALHPHTALTVRNKHEKFEGKCEASFDIPFMVQSHVESMMQIVNRSMLLWVGV
jgi:hypothetical protein